MRIVGFQRVGQQCTISDMKEERSWGDMKTPIKPEIKDSVRGGENFNNLLKPLASMPKPAGF